jgi:ribonuclease D
LTAEPSTRLKPDLFENDLSESRLRHYLARPMIAIDTETRGLVIHRDRLCLVQLSDEAGVVSLVRYHGKPAPHLEELLTAPSVTKLFHFARFDVAVMKYYLGVWTKPIWCTKIASKLVRTYTDRHSLKDLCRELLGMEMDKADQLSDWARDDLSDSQLAYAANDVLRLHELQAKLQALLEREGRQDLAQRLFNFLPTICELDLAGFRDVTEH